MRFKNTTFVKMVIFYRGCASPSVGGGLGVFAFHDVPSGRFAPSFVYFWDSCKHSVELGSLFCLGRLCERRWLSSSPKLVTPLVICSQRKVVSTPEENASFATSPKRFFQKLLELNPPLKKIVQGSKAGNAKEKMTRPYHFKKFDFPKGIPLRKPNFLKR